MNLMCIQGSDVACMDCIWQAIAQAIRLPAAPTGDRPAAGWHIEDVVEAKACKTVVKA